MQLRYGALQKVMDGSVDTDKKGLAVRLREDVKVMGKLGYGSVVM